jgi:phosphotriesterase-related protein
MPHVPTTAGDTDAADLGIVLMHEHVFVRTETLQSGWPGFSGWDTAAELLAARDRLGKLRRAGVDTILDMTVPGLGRDPALVAQAAAGTGLRIMFATGYYTYDNLPFPFQFRGPGKILDGDDDVLESLFERDLTVGIGDTGFRAAVLKIVTDEPGMTPDVARIANAVASVALRTGAPICTHAHAPTLRGLEQQRLLAGSGVDLGRVMIGHSNESTDLDYLSQIIDNGSYLGWDRCGLQLTVPLEAQIDTLVALCERGYSDRIMLAHDKASFMDWFTNDEIAFGAPDWQYSYIPSKMLPALRERGVSQDQIDQMLIGNPRDFFSASASAPPAAGIVG